MKSTFILTAAAIAFSLSANAQQPVVPAPASDSIAAAAQAAVNAEPAASATAVATATDAAPAAAPALPRGASTVDSIAAKYKLQAMPEPLTAQKIFPAIGTYQLSTAAGAAAATDPVTVTLDSTSKGTIWVSGLPQGSFKAYLVKRPATYRIVSQKSATGKAIPEGTLFYSPENATLNIALGSYSAENPTAIFPAALSTDPSVIAAASTAEVKVKTESKKSKTKKKTKVQFFTATKVDAANTLQSTNSAAAYDQLLQQQQQQK